MQILKKYWLGFLALVLIAMASVLIYARLHSRTLPENLVEGTGQIDGDLINLNTMYPGRVESMDTDDGMAVKKGMVIARLDSREQQAQRSQIAAELSARKKSLEAKKIEAGIADSSIPQQLEKAKARMESARSGLSQLKSKIDIQADLLAQARRDFERYKTLYKSRSIDQHKYELAQLEVQTQKEKLETLEASLPQAKAAIAAALSDLRTAEASQRKLMSIKSEIAALEDGVTALEASLERMDIVISQMTLRSPVDGFTVEKIANPGEVIGAGMPVATLIDPSSLYLKIYVDTLNNGRIKRGDRAVIFLDAYPDRAIEAKVVNIAQKAEFTPKEVSVRSDRIQRVYAVHIKPLKKEPLLKLGIPAIGVISTDGGGLPSSLYEIPVL